MSFLFQSSILLLLVTAVTSGPPRAACPSWAGAGPACPSPSGQTLRSRSRCPPRDSGSATDSSTPRRDATAVVTSRHCLLACVASRCRVRDAEGNSSFFGHLDAFLPFNREPDAAVATLLALLVATADGRLCCCPCSAFRNQHDSGQCAHLGRDHHSERCPRSAVCAAFLLLRADVTCCRVQALRTPRTCKRTATLPLPTSSFRVRA